MHLQTVNRDQRRERLYPVREARKQKKQCLFHLFIYLFLFFFLMPRHCECSFVSCFPIPAFHTAKFFGVFFKCKGGVLFFFFFLLPKRIAIPKHALHPSLPHSFTLHLIFPSPTGSPDDTAASMLIFYPPSLPCTYNSFFWGGVSLALFKKRFFSRQVVAPVLTFIWLCANTVSTLCSCWTRARTGHLHMCKDNRKTPLQ